MKRHGILLPLAIGVAALLLWRTPLVFPVKVFVVFLHEASHGIAAVLTGGSVDHLELTANEGGLCVTRGGWRFAILSAGYVGSLVWGALLLVAASRTHLDRAILGAVSVATALVTILYVRTLFGFAYGILAALLTALVAWRLPASASDLVLRVIGTVSCLYVVEDIAADLVVRSVPGSDAHALGELTWIPGRVWGVLWIAVSLAVIAGALSVAARGTPRYASPAPS